MDATDFDALARSLTDGASRRTLLGTALGVLFAIRGHASSDARKKKRKKKCKKKCAAGLVRGPGRCKCVPPAGGGSHKVCPEDMPIVCDTDREDIGTPHCCPADLPVCCDQLAACCWADFPVCCYFGFTAYCCEAGDACCGSGGSCCPPEYRCVNGACVRDACDPPCGGGTHFCCANTSDGRHNVCLQSDRLNCPIPNSQFVAHCPTPPSEVCCLGSDTYSCPGDPPGCPPGETQVLPVACLD
jgi:hypothetical protein